MNNQELRELPLPTVGKQVHFIQTDDTIVRVGEGAFIRLKNGAIMYAYTEYCGGDIRDSGEANIAAIYSYDEGETWQNHRILLHRGDAVNIMSCSFLRLENDEILMFYLSKMKLPGSELVVCRPCVRSSFDECESFGEERCCVDKDNTLFYVVNNDRVIRLQSGRIVIAAAVHDKLTGKGPNGEWIRYIISDDNGKTWNQLDVRHEMPFENLRGFEEPGMYQHEDGAIWSYYRTNIGCQFETVSRDDGETWTTPKPNVFFTGARSPMLVKKVCGDLTVGVFNPISLYTCRNLGGIRGRAPYLLAVSDTDGVSHDATDFKRLYYVETDMDNDYCYPSVLSGEDYFLLAYYHSNGRERPLNCLKIVKVMKNEIQ